MVEPRALPLVSGTFAVLFLLSAWPTILEAATFNVTTAAEFQAALTTAQQNAQADTINVAAGMYDVSGGGLTYVAKSTAPVENFALTIVGAGAGQTVIDGGDADEGLLIETGSGGFDDSSATLTVSGITFQHGAGQTLAGGGGLSIETNLASSTVENSVFESSAGVRGGGLSISSENGDITISSIVASGNQSDNDGAGAYALAGGDVTVVDSLFTGNTSATRGGGLFAHALSSGNVTVAGSMFTGNSAVAPFASSGGVYTETFPPGVTTFVNNTVHGNSGGYAGGANFNAGASIIAHNTVTGNDAVLQGGGMYFELQGGTADIANNIVWGNTADGAGDDIYIADGSPSHVALLRFNNYSELASAGGGTVTEFPSNLTSDPLFVSTADPDPAAWDVHLADGSPAIDAGSNALIASGITLDRDGDNRVADGEANGTATVDMGSDEFIPQPTVSVASPSINFGTTQGEQTLTITNTGIDLTIGSIGAVDPLAPPFAVIADTCSNTTLAQLETCTVTVEFDAATVGAASGMGAMGAGLGFLLVGVAAMGSFRRRRVLALLLVLGTLGAGTLAACNSDDGDGNDRTSYTDSFDIPSNDPTNPSFTINVSGSV